MNKRYYTLFLLFLTACMVCMAQTFCGTVRGKGDGGLAGASIVLKSDAGKTVAYCITNDKGQFRLDVPDGKFPAMVSVSFMGYQKKTIPFAQMKDGMIITLTEGSFKIKEVKVKSQRLHSTGDTLTYSVSGYKQAQDRSIADVIDKIPGLQVKKDGSIEYQGKPISKFYIEGLDLMGAQYGVASENVSADKVKSVQVLLNHEPVKSLRGVTFNEQAALNIVLKEDARAVWAGSADIGSGYGDDFLYDCRLMGMRFDKRLQTLMMYKNNNIGKSLKYEILDLASYKNGRMDTETGILSMMNTSLTDLAEDRYTFNNSHVLAGNWLWKTGENAELRVQGNGYIDRSQMHDHRQATYLTLGDLPVVVEEHDVINTCSQWKGETNYQYNGDKTYVKNNIRGYIDFNKSIGTINCNSQRTDMMVKPRKRSLTEDFQLSHTTNSGNVYNIDSYWSYMYLPGQLLTINGATEQLNLGFFSTQNAMRFKFKVGKCYLNNEAGVNFDHQNIAVNMIEEFEQTKNYNLLRMFWKPSLSLMYGKHKLELRSRLSFVHQVYGDNGSDEVWVEPSLQWMWKASAMTELSADIDYSNTPLMGKAIYDIPIFTGYRNQTVNRGTLEDMHVLTATAAWKYADLTNGMFFNLRPSYTLSSGNVLYKSSLDGDIYTISASEHNYDIHTLDISGRMSKTIGWAKMIVGLSVSHNVTDYSVLVSDNVNDVRMQATMLHFDCSFRPLGILSIEEKSGVNIHNHHNITQRQLSSGSVRDWEHYLNIHILPTQRWMISMKNELFHSSEASVSTNFFMDIALCYKRKRWELSFSVNNILGTSQFERRRLGNTIEQYAITRLRPHEWVAKWNVDL